ncbi:ImmA/IrrE family metallo-endopeptidase [Ralstonia pickettii]|nr:ImmA/IrrE family metallo-endopeptidase [Ralstonia pickettii]
MVNYNKTESIIKDLYTNIDIVSPEQLKIESIAYKLGIAVRYWDFPSEAFAVDEKCFIVLNRNLNKSQLWQEFAHELSHLLLHVGRQELMHILFRQLQEYQANYFSYHFCVPTFMLERLKEVNANLITELFNVEFDFAIRRIEIHQNKKYARSMSL